MRKQLTLIMIATVTACADGSTPPVSDTVQPPDIGVHDWTITVDNGVQPPDINIPDQTVDRPIQPDVCILDHQIIEDNFVQPPDNTIKDPVMPPDRGLIITDAL